MVVSHDREFLARTVTRVVELDLAQQQVRRVRRRLRRPTWRSGRWPAGTPGEEYEEYADTRAGLEDRARTQRDWMEKGVRNARRKATDNDKIGRKTPRRDQREAGGQGPPDRAADRAAGGGRGAAQGVGAADGDRRRAPGRRGRGRRCAARWCARGSFTLGPVDLQIDWADRVAITGAERLGQVDPAGRAAGPARRSTRARPRSGPGVVVGEVDQARGLFLGAEPLLRRLRRSVPELGRRRGAHAAGQVRAAAATCCGRPATLSPGERTRAALALLQARGVNLLVLDEPTNHLDLPAIEQLESALDFRGTLLLVTHDRRMLDAVRTTRRWAVDAGRVTER